MTCSFCGLHFKKLGSHDCQQGKDWRAGKIGARKILGLWKGGRALVHILAEICELGFRLKTYEVYTTSPGYPSEPMMVGF